MVRAAEESGLTPMGLADGGGAMGAAVEQDQHLALLAAGEDDRLAPNGGGGETTRLGHLALVADIHPAPMKDALQLGLEHSRIDVGMAVDPIGKGRAVLVGRLNQGGHVELMAGDPQIRLRRPRSQPRQIRYGHRTPFVTAGTDNAPRVYW